MTQKKIEALTPEQTAKIKDYYNEYLAIGLSTEPCDRQKAEAAIRASYKYLKLPEIENFHWVDSPFVGVVESAKLACYGVNWPEAQKKATSGEDWLKGAMNYIPTSSEIKEQVSRANYGSLEAYWVSFYSFIAEQLPVEKDELSQIVKEIVKDCGVYWTFEKTVIISEKPVAIHMKDGKLHNPDGKALEYKDGTGVFAIEGKRYASLLELSLEQKFGSKESA